MEQRRAAVSDKIGNRAVVGAEGARLRRGERGRVPYFLMQIFDWGNAD
jgi:hypothetical protein